MLHEESRKLGFCTQLKLLVTDKIYFLFVYGPLVSISLIGATDNHLGSLLVPFGITPVRFLPNPKRQAIVLKCLILSTSLFGCLFYWKIFLYRKHQLFYLIFCNCIM